MSYDATTLRLLGGVPGQQLFMYRTADDATDVETSGYFDSAVEHYNLSSGDVVLTVTGYGSTNVLDAMVITVTDGVATSALLS